jgi:hypothetical protein
VSAVVSAEVAEGVRQLEMAFPDQVSHEPDGQGGTYVTVGDIQLGDGWTEVAAPLTLHLAYNYPAAAPYPFYLPARVEPNGTWPEALQRVHWRDTDVLQVSLRHNSWDPGRDTAVGSVFQVRDWLRTL